jgi:photosystem II stability/assembly factor-like uncharacterized protein
MAWKAKALAAIGGNIYAGTDNGIILSTDQGANWTAITSTSTNALVVKSNETGGVSLLAALGDTAVYRSTDSGVTWTRVLQGGMLFISPHVVRRFIRSLVIKDSAIFLGTDAYVLRSTNNGSTWDSVGTRIPFTNGGPLSALAITDSGMFVSDGVDIFHSTVNGTDWNLLPRILPRNSYIISTIYSFASSDTDIVACTTAGIHRSYDKGVSWVPMNNGLNVAAGAPLVVNGSNIFLGGGNGYYLLRSTNYGSSWTILNDSVYYHYRSLAAKGTSVVAGTDGPTTAGEYCSSLFSSNNGASWNTIENSPAAFSTHTYLIDSSNIYAGYPFTSKGFWRYNLDSATWTTVNDGDVSRVYSIAAENSYIYAGTLHQGVYSSPDSGVHWFPINTGLDLFTNITTIVVNGSSLFAGTSIDPSTNPGLPGKGIFRSTNGGNLWAPANTGLTGNNISDIAVSGQKIIAGTDSNGIFLSIDNGDHWHPFNEGLPNLNIASLGLNDTYMYAGLPGGLWRRPLSEAIVSVSPSHAAIPMRFAMEQNYPNPFNPTTTISYALPKASHVTLKVYDMLGREVTTLVNDHRDQGRYTATFDATHLASGVYVSRLVAGDYTKTIKMLMLK